MLLKGHFHITSGDFLLGHGWRGEIRGGRPSWNLFIPRSFLATPHHPSPPQICWVCHLRLSHIDKFKVHPGMWARKENKTHIPTAVGTWHNIGKGREGKGKHKREGQRKGEERQKGRRGGKRDSEVILNKCLYIYPHSVSNTLIINKVGDLCSRHRAKLHYTLQHCEARTIINSILQVRKLRLERLSNLSKIPQLMRMEPEFGLRSDKSRTDWFLPFFLFFPLLCLLKGPDHFVSLLLTLLEGGDHPSSRAHQVSLTSDRQSQGTEFLPQNPRSAVSQARGADKEPGWLGHVKLKEHSGLKKRYCEVLKAGRNGPGTESTRGSSSDMHSEIRASQGPPS